MIKRLTNSLSVTLVLMSSYTLGCLADILLTDPVKMKVVSVEIIDEKTGDIINVVNNFDTAFMIKKQNSFIVTYDVTRYRSAKVINQRKILELEDKSIYLSNIELKTVVPESAKLKTYIQIPNFLKYGCKVFYTDSFYEYTFNIITIVSPLKFKLPSIKFCIV